MPEPFKLVFVTGNAYKLNEARIILGPDAELESVTLDIPEIQGTAEEIAVEKCRRAAEILQRPVLIDDTSLCFHAMGGLPGPYIKSFLEALGNRNLYKMLDGFDNKSADFVCTVACTAGADQEIVVFQERMTGKIVPGRGPDFGILSWNPSFEVDGTTFGEMSEDDPRLIGPRS
ncbi:nucleoside triphosphate pyrophosphohydrolase ham1 [Didymella keratinophila]|nr:nucleoside triphosphate pyrophosphohydrolase ham1 [Didymella keratinophila]